MGDTSPVAELIRKIEANDASAAEAVKALKDRCLVDERNRSLFDVAILADNSEVIGLLASDTSALAFSAPVDQKTEGPLKHAVASIDVEVPISSLETNLEQAFGPDLAYGRTPLHTACRAGNTRAIETLLAAGASSAEKDVTGLTAPEVAFFAHGEKGLRGFLDAFERNGQKAFPVGKRLLEETLAFPGTLDRLLQLGKLDANARRLLFNYRCAWLDLDAVRKMLGEGYDINKGLTSRLNPLWQACTSALLWDAEIPGGLEMSFHYTKHIGHPGASAVSVDNALLNEDGSNFGKLFAQAERARKELIASIEKMSLEPEEERRIVGRRIELLDILFDAGADLGLARKKPDVLATFDDLKRMKLGAIADHIKQRGGAAKPASKPRKPAATTFWDLVGETGLNTEYWPEEGEGGLLRLILHDSYGPVDGVELSVRVSRDKKKSGREWQVLKPVNETLLVDEEMVSRAELNEPVYGETPWEAIFEFPLNRKAGSRVLWIRLDHPDNERLRGELDPWKFAKG